MISYLFLFEQHRTQIVIHSLFKCHHDNLDLEPFPTRRSSDLHRVPHWLFGINPASKHNEIALIRSEEHTLNSSHVAISYAVFCLKKKKTKINTLPNIEIIFVSLTNSRNLTELTRCPHNLKAYA